MLLKYLLGGGLGVQGVGSIGGGLDVMGDGSKAVVWILWVLVVRRWSIPVLLKYLVVGGG